MKKTKVKLILDAILLLCIAAIGGIGFLMKYVLVPGYMRWQIYNRNVELYFCGMDRHEWGTIHLVIGFVFLALLVLHIALHWDMILTIYKKLMPNRLARWIVALTLVCITILLFAFPYFVKPDVQQRGREGERGGRWQETPAR